MAQTFLLRGAKQLLTLRGPGGVRRGAALSDLSIIEDGSVLIQDGRIAKLGSTRRLENLKESRTAIEIPAEGSIVLPGFVDAGLHLHLQNGRPAKRKTLTDFYSETLALMRSCLQHGTLTAEVKSSSGAADFRSDVSVLRQLARLGDQPVDVVRTWSLDRLPAAEDPVPHDFRDTLSTIALRKLVRFIEMTSEGGHLPSADLIESAKRANLPPKLFWPGGSPGQLAETLAQLNPFAISCPSVMSPGECEVLARSAAIVVFSPGREFLEERGGDCAKQLFEAGAAIALSSGYDATYAPTFSMQTGIALATLRLRLPVEVAISAATINAAYAVGCGDLVGSIEVGKRADLLVLNIPDYREIPRRFGINNVGIAIRNGNVVLNRTRWKIGN